MTVFLISQKKDEDDVNVKYRRYGFGLGYNPLMIFQNFEEINFQLKKAGLGELTPNGMYNHAFQLYSYSGFLSNFRVGLIWSAGTRSVKADFQDVTRQYEYNLDFWAVSFDYAYPVLRRSSIALGCLLGRGTQEQIFTQNNKNTISWEDFWSNFNKGQAVSNYRNNLNSAFFLFSPYLSFEYGVSDFIAVRATGGYLGSVKSSLELENFFEIKDIPSKVSINNLYFQVGILFGIFMD
jgi:hypothetical protein